jgi:broad specificity phosphatase PhoE
VSARLRLIRHGTAAPALDDHDPGLSLAGSREAIALAQRVGHEAPARLITSPLRRARETALPLAAAFGIDREIDEAFAELPWRDGQSLEDRHAELRHALHASWSDLDSERRRWRDELVRHALAQTGDAVIVTHFVAINVLVGAALGDDRTTVFRPGNASLTEIEIANGAIRLVSLGHEQTQPLAL